MIELGRRVTGRRPARRPCRRPPPGTKRCSGGADLLESEADRILGRQRRRCGPGRARSGADATSLDRLRLDDGRVAAMARGPAHGGRAARPGRRGGRRLGSAQRPPGPAGPGPARRGRHHLREPPQRDQRRRRPVPQVGQRRDVAGLVLGHRLQHGRSPPRSATGWPKPGSRPTPWPGRGHHPGGAPCLHAAGRLHRLPHPPGWPVAGGHRSEHATVPYVIDGAGNCHVYVDAAADLYHGRVDRRQRQDPASGVCNSRRDAAGPPGGGRGVPAPGGGRPDRRRRLLGDDRDPGVLPGAEEATDEDFATEFLDLTLSRGRGRRPRRRHRPHHPVRVRVTPRPS